MTPETRSNTTATAQRRLTYTDFLILHGKPYFEPMTPEGVRKFDDLSGIPFDKLLPISPVIASANFLGPRWSCRCICNGRRQVRAKHLLSGIVSDCGCRKRSRFRKRKQRARLVRLKNDPTMKKLHGTKGRKSLNTITPMLS